jgi:ferredoxin-nitrite reductase
MLEDTADIGFAAVRVGPDKAVPPGVYFRMLLGGLTGHGGFARDSGVLLQPEEVLPAAVTIIRLFIAHGDRTDRKRARLHHLVERWGIEKCLAEAAADLPFPWRFVPIDDCEPRGAIDRHGHIGVHPQAQPARFYAGSYCGTIANRPVAWSGGYCRALRIGHIAADGVAKSAALRHS